jgi:hypothetical protein
VFLGPEVEGVNTKRQVDLMVRREPEVKSGSSVWSQGHTVGLAGVEVLIGNWP